MISYSEIQAYLDCEKKHDLIYNKKIKIDTPHFQFGSMAHNAMELRKIPSEELYPELKEYFNIKNWEAYFSKIFKSVDELLSEYTIIDKEYSFNHKGLKGRIDLILYKDNKFYILDYKFSSSTKTIEDIELDQQLDIYAGVYSMINNIDINDIYVGYISIPKADLEEPTILKNGNLSKSKAQKITYDSYLNKIHELGLNEEDYADFLEEIKDRKLIEFVFTSINNDKLVRVFKNLENVTKDMEKGYYLERFDNYKCKMCEYKEFCKNRG